MTMMIENNKKIKKRILSKTGLMSDTKYKKFFALCKKYGFEVGRVKTLNDDRLYEIYLCLESGNESYTADGVAGPVKLSFIEYLIIDIEHQEDFSADQFVQDLNKIGKFNYKIDSKNIVIYAYI